MRFWLIWFALQFDPQTHYAEVLMEQSEEHLSAYSCELARRELYALTRIRGVCVPKQHIRLDPHYSRPGTWIRGRYISRYERG